MTTEINYEQKVLEVYPKSYVDNPEFHRFYYVYVDLIGVEIGKGLNMQEAWQSAYENLVASGKIQPDQPTKTAAEVAAEEWVDATYGSGEIEMQKCFIAGYNAKQSDAVKFYHYTNLFRRDEETGTFYKNGEWLTIEQLYEQFKHDLGLIKPE